MHLETTIVAKTHGTDNIWVKSVYVFPKRVCLSEFLKKKTFKPLRTMPGHKKSLKRKEANCILFRIFSTIITLYYE